MTRMKWFLSSSRAFTDTSQTCHGRKGQRKLVHTLFAEEVARVELFLGWLEARLLLLDIILNTRMIILTYEELLPLSYPIPIG